MASMPTGGGSDRTRVERRSSSRAHDEEEEGVSGREVAKRAADSNDDLVQEVLADAAARPLLEEGCVDGRELLAKQDAVVAQATAT